MKIILILLASVMGFSSVGVSTPGCFSIFMDEQKLLMSRATNGSKQDQFDLAIMYIYGTGVKQSDTQAFKYFLLAANAGHVESQYHIGWMYFSGKKTTPQDYKIALKWFTLAAKQRHPRSQYNVGLMYEKGMGVDKSISLAYRWYSRSAKNNYAPAQRKIGDMYFRGIYVTRSYKKAFSYYRKAALQKDENSLYLLGFLYKEGLGVTRNLGTAINYYKKSARAGNASAQYELGSFYLSRNIETTINHNYDKTQTDGITQIINKRFIIARKYMIQAANRGDARAQFSLAQMLLKGQGGDKNHVEAIVLLKEAASQKHPSAIEELKKITDIDK